MFQLVVANNNNSSGLFPTNPNEQRYIDFENPNPLLGQRGAPIGFDNTTDPVGREFAELYSKKVAKIYFFVQKVLTFPR